MGQRILTATALLMLLAAPDKPAAAQTLSHQLKAESVAKLAEDARANGNAVRGAILFTRRTLSCTRCHTASATKAAGPDLNGLGGRVNDVYLVEALLQPSKAIKKGFESVTVVTIAGMTLAGRIVEEGPERLVLQLSSGDLQRVTLPRGEIAEIAPSKLSAMPDDLVDHLANRGEFLDLVRYVMELAAAGKSQAGQVHVAGGGKIRPELQGLVLIKEFNCAACHHDDITQTLLGGKQAPVLPRSIGRIDPHFLQRFIAAPLSVKAGTTMPDVMSALGNTERQTAAREITHYLVSLGAQPFAGRSLDSEAAARGQKLFHTIGCVSCHSPRDGDGGELLVETSVPLGDIRNKSNLDGLVAFLKDPLETRPSGRMPKMQLTHWEAVDLANYLLSHPKGGSTSGSFELDQHLVAQGKARFDQLGCRQCHRVDSADVSPRSLALSKVRSNQGCMSGETGHWPTFGLSRTQRQAIQASLDREPQKLSRDDQLRVTLTGLRCLKCHQREELGGVSAERDPHFQTTNPNLGPQGRIPPPLTGVGAKLNRTWMRQVLVSGRAVRPYALTRMPQFGTANVAHLVDLFQQVDQLPPVDFPDVNDGKELRKIGGEMVGAGGLNCIVCHTFQLKKAANMPAVDLTEMAERLKKTWFYHYMRDPQRLSRNTIMPSFWPGGRAMRHDILDGNRALQIEALWQYLLDGRQARTPRGLVVEPLALLATDEAVMLRRSFPGIGKRGIGVGYPNQVNLAFDAEQMRLAMIWQGKFADPGGVWRSQGHGRVRPLGDKLIQFAPGPDLDDATNPWTVDDGRPPHHQFKGYSLDHKMRPRFRYQFGAVNIEDYPVDMVESNGRPFIRRTILLKSESRHDGLAFRVGTGKSIAPSVDGWFLVDDQLRIHVGQPHSATIVNGNDFQQLRVPLTIVGGSARLTLDYKW